MENRDEPVTDEQYIGELRKEVHGLKQQLMHEQICHQQSKDRLKVILEVDLKEFTKAAMQGLCACDDNFHELSEDAIGKISVCVAQATLKALEEVSNG